MAEQAVTDYANSQIPGLGDVLSLVGPARHCGNGAADDAGDRARSRSRANGTCPIAYDRNSFTGDTPVLMADGTVKRIDRIREGDEVRTTDPTTGETADRTVTDTRSRCGSSPARPVRGACGDPAAGGGVVPGSAGSISRVPARRTGRPSRTQSAVGQP